MTLSEEYEKEIDLDRLVDALTRLTQDELGNLAEALTETNEKAAESLSFFLGAYLQDKHMTEDEENGKN